jgi:hypothetical protein
MPAFIHDEGGSIASHYPINHFILESGQQNIKLKVLPLKGESALREDASLEIKVHFYDSATNNYDALTEVFKFETPDGITNKTKGAVSSTSMKGIPASFIVKPPNLLFT